MKCSWLLVLLLTASRSYADADTLHVRCGVNDVAWVAESDSTASVTVVDRRTSRIIFRARLTEVYAGHYHPAEYRNGHLYAIRRIGNWHWPSNAWTDELWRYEGREPRTRLCADKGLDFRVAPNESVVVVNSGTCDPPGTGRLIAYSVDGTVIRTFRASDLRFDCIGSMWVTNQFVFASLGNPPGAGFDRLVRIAIHDWSSTLYEFSELTIDSDFDFDPDTQVIAGSDKPFLYDVESEQEWKKNHPVVTLHLYDLTTRTSTAIATSVAKSFDPRWIDKGLLEFTDSKTGKRVTRIVGSSSSRPR